MKAEHVNAFLVPSVQVLQKMAKIEVRLGKIQRLVGRRLDGHVSILIGLQGRLGGSVILTSEWPVARKLAGCVLGGELGESEDGEVRTILAEIANTIVGNATGHLYDLGIREGITPPTVVEGGNFSFEFGTGLESVLVPLDTDAGRLDMIVSLSREDP